MLLQKRLWYTLITVVILLASKQGQKLYIRLNQTYSLLTPQNTKIGVLSVNEVLTHISHEMKIRVAVDTGLLSKTFFKILQTSKQLAYTAIATVQIGYQQDDIIDPVTRRMITKNFPPLRILRVFFEIQKIDTIEDNFFNRWGHEQLNQHISKKAHDGIRERIASDDRVQSVVHEISQKMRQLGWVSSKLPELELNLDSIEDAQFSMARQ